MGDRKWVIINDHKWVDNIFVKVARLKGECGGRAWRRKESCGLEIKQKRTLDHKKVIDK